MPKNLPFTIYNASAGSGKTYTLVKEYLKILFKSNNTDLFKRILAITFTNKAVAEMKERVISTLKTFSSDTILLESNSMFETICEELKMHPKDLKKKSKTLLQTIIHNYAAFDISTIDGFTHKLIRTFAYDLKLPVNFEVELDEHTLLNEAVDSLIAKAGTSKQLTDTLVEFAIEKVDDDKSWDVSFDFNKIAKLLINENDKPFLSSLKDKTLDDFKTLKKIVAKEVFNLKATIIQKSKDTLALIEEAGIEHSDFSRGTLPNHFIKASKLELDRLYDNKLEEYITERKNIYNKSLNPTISNTIELILPEIETQFKAIKTLVFQLKFLKVFYKNITPLSVLNAINNELIALKQSQNKVLISEFNTIISHEIKNQPTPFIYERIGEKFKHYFIDEFQDTSTMQWENLIPLLDNSVSGVNGSTMLVGDAKQAIYRWRGGKAEQFIDLFNKKTFPFQVKQGIKNLEENYRSFKEIVSFNNGFFSFLAHAVFNDSDYKSLYESSPQNITRTEQGYVELSFLDIQKQDNRDELFPEQVLKTIKNCLEQGFGLEDICVIVRKKKEGVAIAEYLSEKGVPIISSETLLLNNSPEVVFINDLLTLLTHPKKNEIKIKVLTYLASLFNIEDKHSFFVKHIGLSNERLFKRFEAFNVFVTNTKLLQLPLYDLAETIVRSFNLVKDSNAYIQFYLDIILDFSQKKGSDITGFLNYFDKKKENLSIVSPQGQNAVQIMTIHKSKGLEFQVVIFPYADLDIYREQDPKEWFKLDKEKYNGFSYTLLNYNKDFQYFGDEGLGLYKRHQSELELDNINLLYVAMTRAVEHLYVISTKDINSKGIITKNKYSGLLITYLKNIEIWNDIDSVYSFGIKKKNTNSIKTTDTTHFQKEFISTSKEEHNIKIITKSASMWDTEQELAVEKGNLIHNIMAQIYTIYDVDNAINTFAKASVMKKEQLHPLKQTVLNIVKHPDLIAFYQPNNTVYNERDIIDKSGKVLRPDRININNENEAIIIDYKTGNEEIKHIRQLWLYQDVMESMEIKVKKRILVYVNEEIMVKEV